MFPEFYSFFVYFFLAFIITLVLTFGSGQLFLREFDYEKFSAYECGFDPFEHTKTSFDVRFYLVAIFYIIFDLEVVFLFPLTISLPLLDFTSLFFLGSFLIFLFFGIVYEFLYTKLDWS